MAGSTAEINWTSNDSQVLRTFQKVERGFDDIARRMDRIEKKADQASRATVGGFDKVTKSVGNAAMALIGGGSLLTAIDLVRDANRKMLEEAQEVGKRYDEIFRKFQIQAGLTAMQAESAKQKILNIAQESGVTEENAGAAATQLVSSGFSVQEATGGSLREFLRIMAASNAAGKGPQDSTTLAKAAASYLESQGMAKTADNLATVGRGVQRLFKGTNVQLADFGELAKQGAALQPYMTPQEQLAAFSTLVDVMPAAESATGLQNIVGRLTTAGASKDKIAALKAIGLKPGDVDLVGENLVTALGRMQGGLQGIPEEKRAGVLKKLFEEAGVSIFNTLANRAGDIPGRIAMQQDAAGFMRDVAIGEAGRASTATRLDVQLNRMKELEDAGDDLVQKAMEAEMIERGYSPAARTVQSARYWLHRSLGGSQEGFLNPYGLGFDEEITRDIYQRIRDASQGDTGAAKLEQAIRENTDATKESTRQGGQQRALPSAALRR